MALVPAAVEIKGKPKRKPEDDDLNRMCRLMEPSLVVELLDDVAMKPFEDQDDDTSKRHLLQMEGVRASRSCDIILGCVFLTVAWSREARERLLRKWIPKEKRHHLKEVITGAVLTMVQCKPHVSDMGIVFPRSETLAAMVGDIRRMYLTGTFM
jgi:hypothetical protein